MEEYVERACEPKEPQAFLDFKEIELSLRDKEFIKMRDEMAYLNCRCVWIPPEYLK